MPALSSIWVTRTQPQADATAQRLRGMGLVPVVAPVLVARPCLGAVIDLGDVDAIAFTSGHAVRAFAAISPARDLPAYAVGETTAAYASAAGFNRVQAAPAGDVRGLADLIAGAKPLPRHVLNPTARAPAADLAALLAVHGVEARAVVVYETAAVDPVGVPDDIDGILVHSPKAARIVAGAVTSNQARRLSVFAISAAAAAPLLAMPFADIRTATFPDEAHLLNLLQG